MSTEMKQTSMFKRRELEQKIEQALAALEPDGELLGTMLGRYTHWQFLQEVPGEEIARVVVRADKERGFRDWLGDARYFDTLTAAAKIRLYRAALDTMENALAFLGYKPDDGIFWETFRHAWNMALKECRISQEAQDITATQAPAESTPESTPESTAKSTRKSTQKSTAAKKQKKRAPAKRAAFQKPTIKEVMDYCLERKNSVDPTAFWHHYESNGWKVGKEPMKSWKSAVITWERREEYAQRDRLEANHVGYGMNRVPVGRKVDSTKGDLLADRGYVPLPKTKDGGDSA